MALSKIQNHPDKFHSQAEMPCLPPDDTAKTVEGVAAEGVAAAEVTPNVVAPAGQVVL